MMKLVDQANIQGRVRIVMLFILLSFQPATRNLQIGPGQVESKQAKA